VVSGCIEDVELMDFVTNSVQFPVEVLNGRRVRVLELVVKEPETKEFSHRARVREILSHKVNTFKGPSTLKTGVITLYVTYNIYTGAPGGKINILVGHSIGHFKQRSVDVDVSYSERFRR
jgi:hypothetical protein